MSKKTLFPYIDPPPPGLVGRVDGIKGDVKILDPNHGVLGTYNKEVI